jgi:transcription elongation factor GreA
LPVFINIFIFAGAKSPETGILFCFIRSGELVMSKISFMTQEGLEKIKKELDQLVNVERPAISQLIADARDKGDLAENAEYHAAKEAQGLLELRIAKLQDQLVNSRILDESQIDTSKVQILNRVKIKNTTSNAVMEYHIVPESEADLKAGKMSISTPIAQGLLGKKVGDVVSVKVPSGEIGFEILGISM